MTTDLYSSLLIQTRSVISSSKQAYSINLNRIKCEVLTVFCRCSERLDKDCSQASQVTIPAMTAVSWPYLTFSILGLQVPDGIAVSDLLQASENLAAIKQHQLFQLRNADFQSLTAVGAPGTLLRLYAPHREKCMLSSEGKILLKECVLSCN
jgi:hypothetical protein